MDTVRLERLGQEVLALCQHRAAAAGWQTKRWRVSYGEENKFDWNQNSADWLMLINVDFICPCGGVRTLTTLQAINITLLYDACFDVAGVIADSVAETIVCEFQKHTDGEPAH